MNGLITIRAKFIGFDERQDCDCIDEAGKKIKIDPFVGCAFEYQQREHLIGQWFEMSGHYYKDGTFLPREGRMKILTPNHYE